LGARDVNKTNYKKLVTQNHDYTQVPDEIKRSRDLEEGGGAGPSS